LNTLSLFFSSFFQICNLLEIILQGQSIISKNEQQKKQPMLLDCHVVTLARSFLFRKFVSVAQTVLVKILSKNFHKGIIDFLQIVVLRVLTKLEKAQTTRV